MQVLPEVFAGFFLKESGTINPAAQKTDYINTSAALCNNSSPCCPRNSHTRHNTVDRGQYPYVYVCIAWYCSTVCLGRWSDCNGKGQICVPATSWKGVPVKEYPNNAINSNPNMISMAFFTLPVALYLSMSDHPFFTPIQASIWRVLDGYMLF